MPNENNNIDKSQGYVKIYRKIQDGDLWNDGKPYSKFKAWVWLLLNVRGVPYKFNSSLTIKRGEILTSTSKLAEKWGWSKKTVWLFLDYLRKEQRIDSKRIGKRIGTLISILNYNDFNPLVNSKINSGLPDNYPEITQKLPDKETQDNKEKKEKNLNNISTLSKLISNSDIFCVVVNFPSYPNWVLRAEQDNPDCDYEYVIKKLELEYIALYPDGKYPNGNVLMAKLGGWISNERNYSKNNSSNGKQPKHGDHKSGKKGDHRDDRDYYWNPIEILDGDEWIKYDKSGEWVNFETWQAKCVNQAGGVGYFLGDGSGKQQTERCEDVED